MSNQEEAAQQRQQTWKLLSAVEDHAQIQLWLQDVDASASAAADVHRPSPRKAWSRSKLTWAFGAVAGVAAAVVIALHVLLAPLQFETGVGEQRDVLLADGSRITLNTATAVTVRYSGKRRAIELERGEALFTVKSDPERPFEVTSGPIITRALGTEFNVDLRRDRTVVSVLEGVVRVAAVEPDDAAKNDGVVNALGKGQALEVSPHDRAFRQTQADLRRIAAWRNRRLEFSNTPFGEAVAEFNRYSATRLTIGTPQLRDLRVSGVFSIGDTESFLFSIQAALQIDAHPSEGEIVLVRRPAVYTLSTDLRPEV